MRFLYRKSYEEAKICEETELWRESRIENIRCCKEIDKAVSESFDGYSLSDSGAESVIARFGYDRAMWVLAASIRNNANDGRFSEDNKAWAKSVIPSHISQKETIEYCSDCHPAVLNGFTEQVREKYARLGLLGSKQCVHSDEPQDYTNKLMIIKPELLTEEYRKPEYQYFYAADGCGCDPEKPGGLVFGNHLIDGDRASLRRGEFIGIADREQLPKWAVKRLEYMSAPQMKIRIFQIDHEKDENKLAFMDYDYTQSHGGVKAENYRQVYGGTVNCGNLEEVFALCNSDKLPPGYCGEAMSVSNVIEVCGGKDKGFYFCDSVGFRPIDFDILRTDHLDMMRIVVAEAVKAPYVAEIRRELQAMQSVVGGRIEPIYFEPDNDAVAWCNEEFLLYDYEPNRVIGGVLVHGTLYISGNELTNDGWDSRSLTSPQIVKYLAALAQPVLELEESPSLQEDGLTIIM